MRKLILLLPIIILFIACQKEITGDVTVTTPGSSSGTAVYKLSGAGSTCTGFVLSGVYQAGTAMVSGDSVLLQVTVDTIGTYLISTNTTNGILFKTSGTFTKTGLQSITLTATGTPTAAGSFTYTPPVGTGCNFTVTVIAATNATIGDYYPTTTNSTWTLVDTTDPTNYTTNTVLSKTSLFSGNTYINFSSFDGSLRDTGYIRKLLPNYYQYSSAQGLVTTEQIILKDNVAAGSTWQYQYPVSSNGVSGTLTMSYKILEKAVPATVGTFNFPNVIKVRQTTTFSAAGVNIEPSPQIDQWYALNVGPVKISRIDIYRTYSDTIGTFNIKSYKIY